MKRLHKGPSTFHKGRPHLMGEGGKSKVDTCRRRGRARGVSG